MKNYEVKYKEGGGGGGGIRQRCKPRSGKKEIKTPFQMEYYIKNSDPFPIVIFIDADVYKDCGLRVLDPTPPFAELTALQ